MADYMRAAYVKSPGQVDLRRVPVPQPGTNHALVRLAASGICGTDIHIAFERAREWEPLGHELAGVVVDVGAGTTLAQLGERVAIRCGETCGVCRACKQGRPIRCANPVAFYGQAPGFAQYISVHERLLVGVGDLPFAATALIEPFSVALGALAMVEPQPDDTVLIIGPGPIGLMALAALRQRGLKRIVVAGRAHSAARMRLAHTLGAARVVAVDREDLAGVLHNEFSAGADKIICTAGPSSVTQAVDVAAPDGIITYIGLSSENDRTISFDADKFHFKQLQLRPYSGPANFFWEAIDLLKAGALPVGQFITHRFALEDLAAGLAWTARERERTIKTLVEIDRELLANEAV